jgi:hypothetical protein
VRSLLLLPLLLFTPWPAAAQLPGDAFLDATAALLVERARTERSASRTITSYTALVQRRSQAGLRMPLRDRLLGREETAARVRWSRDGTTVIHMLGGRSQTFSGGVSPATFSGPFDPAGDRFYFGARLGEGDENFWIAHPLADGSEQHYRYRSGDTLTLRLAEGHTLRVVELRALPRTTAYNFMHAALWIEPESGALVRAIYRPARNLDVERDRALMDDDDLEELRRLPRLIRPIQLDVEAVVVEYSLWSLRHWLPRLVRVEGHARAGVFRVPFSTETAYRIEAVEDEQSTDAVEPAPEEVLADWGVRGAVPANRERKAGQPAVFHPADRERLITSPELPPPIGKDAPAFASQEEIDALVAQLERAIPRRGGAAAPELRFTWGWQELDLLRYNRVEALSVGARLRLEHPLAEAAATVRLGPGDLHPNGQLELTGLGRRQRVRLEVRHALESFDDGGALGIGNTVTALLFGRDEGEYYRAAGARLSLLPSDVLRASYRLTLLAERQRGVEVGTHWSVPRLLDRGREFRPVLPADAVDLLGVGLRLAPWWGTDPLGAQGGIEVAADGGTGTMSFVRAAVTGRAALPLGTRTRLGIEAAAGSSAGALPLQYHWLLGGPRTLRGYAGGAALGTSLLRSRIELARGSAGRALVLFADAGWAGERGAFTPDDALLSVGVGTSFLDGILRADLARALRAPVGWRLDLYLDALL